MAYRELLRSMLDWHTHVMNCKACSFAPCEEGRCLLRALTEAMHDWQKWGNIRSRFKKSA
jgi:hypothetical protein